MSFKAAAATVTLREDTNSKKRSNRPYGLNEGVNFKRERPHKISLRFLHERARKRGWLDTTETPENVTGIWVPVSDATAQKGGIKKKDTYYSRFSQCTNNEECAMLDRTGWYAKYDHAIYNAFADEYAETQLKMVKPGIDPNQIYRVEVEKIVEKIVEKEVEVEKIIIKEVQKIVEVEIPVALTFEQREIMTNMFHREQNIINEQLRLAMLDNSDARASVLSGRLAALKQTMTMLGIPIDDYSNTKVWLMGVDFSVPYEDDNGQTIISPLWRIK